LEAPVHNFPPNAGAGLSQFLNFVKVPEPQVDEHCPGVDHAPQLPLTTEPNKKYL